MPDAAAYPRGKYALFWVGPRPVSEASKVVRVVLRCGVEFNPVEPDCLVFKAPCLNEFEGARQKWIGGPNEKRAIVGGEFAYR